jgi:DNA mismatch endonuclease (patch repair protein)
MADVFTRQKRSEVMAKVRSKDTKPEMAVRRALHAMGFRFRLHSSNLPGRPDIVLRKLGTIIQVNGCFWHGHFCLGGRVPESHRPYWAAKIEENKVRDRRNERRLRAMGWRVRKVWECRLRRLTPAELHVHLQALLAGVRRADTSAAPLRQPLQVFSPKPVYSSQRGSERGASREPKRDTKAEGSRGEERLRGSPHRRLRSRVRGRAVRIGSRG